MYQISKKTQKKWFSGPRVVKKCKPVGSCPSEYDEQVSFVKWLTDQGYKFSAIPMSTWTSFSQQNKNTAQGVRAGLPDLLVIVNNSLVWIELKKIDRKPVRGGSGGVSEVQKEWIEALNGCGNCSAHVCYGAEEAKEVIMVLDKLSGSC